jgi:hypothetical protein
LAYDVLQLSAAVERHMTSLDTAVAALNSIGAAVQS